MMLEELVFKRLAGNEELKSILASYAGAPAIFHQFAPADSQFPYIIYTLDWKVDQETKRVGTVRTVLCSESAGQSPDQAVIIVKECLTDIFLKSDQTLYYCPWRETNENTLETSIQFDILEYSGQETTDPDPVVAMNQYIKDMIPEGIVIGYDPVEEVVPIEMDVPIIYCRIEEVIKDGESSTVAWMNCKMAVYIFCQSSEMRLKMMVAIANKLSVDSEVLLLDDSPMSIQTVTVDNRVDYLTNGQLHLTARYGLLRYQSSQPSLNKVIFT